MTRTTSTIALLTLCMALALPGCESTHPTTAPDVRVVDDNAVASDISRRLQAADPRLTSAHIVVACHDGSVLLAGEVPSDDLRALAQQIAEAVTDVRVVHNELTVGAATSFASRGNDAWLLAKVRSTLAEQKVAPRNTIEATIVDGVVYLMGRVTRAQADAAVAAAQSVSGIKKIVRVFDYTD